MVYLIGIWMPSAIPFFANRIKVGYIQGIPFLSAHNILLVLSSGCSRKCHLLTPGLWHMVYENNKTSWFLQSMVIILWAWSHIQDPTTNCSQYHAHKGEEVWWPFSLFRSVSRAMQPDCRVQNMWLPEGLLTIWCIRFMLVVLPQPQMVEWQHI